MRPEFTYYNALRDQLHVTEAVYDKIATETFDELTRLSLLRCNLRWPSTTIKQNLPGLDALLQERFPRVFSNIPNPRRQAIVFRFVQRVNNDALKWMRKGHQRPKPFCPTAPRRKKVTTSTDRMSRQPATLTSYKKLMKSPS